MTTNDNEGKPGYGARDQRPHVTLDLKATEVRSEATPGSSDTAAAPKDAPKDHAGESTHVEMPPYDEPEPEAPKPETPVRKRLFSSTKLNEASAQAFATHLVAGLLGSLVALIAAYYGAGAFRERLPLLTERNAQDFQSRIAAYDARIAAYEARLNKQDERIAATEKAASAQRQDFTQAQARMQLLTDQAGVLKQEIALLNKRIEDRPAATAAVPGGSPESAQQSVEPLKAKIAELDARIGQMAKSQTDGQLDARASALTASLYGLRRAVNDGKPYAAELQAIASLTPVPLDLDALNAHREKGVRSLQQLQASFEPAVNAAIDAEGKAADTSIAGGIWSRMKTLVRVRRVGEVTGDDTQAILARAEVRLNAGDVRAAVAEATKVKGAAAEAFKPWLDSARAKIAADDAVGRVEATLLAALGGEKGKKG